LLTCVSKAKAGGGSKCPTELPQQTRRWPTFGGCNCSSINKYWAATESRQQEAKASQQRLENQDINPTVKDFCVNGKQAS